jgi:hypothetical protein
MDENNNAPVEELKDLTAEDILAAHDEEIRAVAVPEWGGRVWVKGITGTERDRFEQSQLEGRGRNRQVNLNMFRARLVAAAAIRSETDKRPLFDISQVQRLGQKSAKALQRVFDVASDLAGMSDEDVENMTKELGKDQNGDSGSGSPSLSVLQ